MEANMYQMHVNSALYVILAITVIINIASAGLWIWLLCLVHAADKILSSRTASIYATYLFQQMMQSRFFRAPRAVSLGNPDRDLVIRTVRHMRQFSIIEATASLLKELPVNIVPFLV